MEKINTIPTDVITQLAKMAEIQQESIEQLVSLYCQERFLYRLSISPYNEQFYIEGDLLSFILTKEAEKPPKEMTLTAQQSAYQNDIVKQAFTEICSIAVPEDGVRFLEDGIESTITNANIILKIPAALAEITTYIEIKITFEENRVSPKTITFPTLLDMKSAMLYTYPTEYVVALSLLDMYQYPANTSKELLDVEMLLQTQNLEGRDLQAYLEELFDRHRLTFEANPPLEKGLLKQFLSPVYEVILAEEEFFKQWNCERRAWQ